MEVLYQTIVTPDSRLPGDGAAEPVNADDHEDAGGEDEPTGPEHHEDFAENIPRLPLNGQSPDGLHGEDDEADDGVRHSEVEDEIVDVRPALNLWSERERERVRHSVVQLGIRTSF